VYEVVLTVIDCEKKNKTSKFKIITFFSSADNLELLKDKIYKINILVFDII
jgi:hypothetical protein